MDRDTIIDGLRMTMELCVFDPSTGEEIEPHLLNDISKATYDACKGALEILEQLPANNSETPNSSDTISRQAAIDGKICIRRSNGVEIYDDYVVPVEYLKQLPPTQPEPSQLSTNLAEVGTDLISRAKAIKALSTITMYKGSIPFNTAVMRIEQLPSAQPEIIRCKDCKYARLTNDGSCKYCDIWFPDEAEYMDGDYYCASAERRTTFAVG